MNLLKRLRQLRVDPDAARLSARQVAELTDRINGLVRQEMVQRADLRDVKKRNPGGHRV